MGDRRYSASAFTPAASRQTSVALLRNVATGDHRVVTSISTRKSTEVLRINLRSGRLELENDRWAESSYENESEALDHLQSRGYEVAERGYALLGYAVAGPIAGLLLATRVREKAVLPGGHTVYAVTDSQWATVPLQNEAADAAAAAALAGLPPPKAHSAALEFWRGMQQFTLNNAHYYCETADISRPFPSGSDPRDPNPEFVWNSWLRQPLVELGLYDHCPALMQGAVECSSQTLPGGARFSMCLISRRSRRHPGTRYIARGLNTLAGPGNEIECELVTWTHPEQRHFRSASGSDVGASSNGGGGDYTATSFSGMPGVAGGAWSGGSDGVAERLRWARVVWRRGTVPIWWGVQLQSLAQGLQAEVYVREEHPYQGTASYFRNVQRQHVPHPPVPLHPDPASSAGRPPAGAAGGAADAGSSGGGGGTSEGWTLVEGAGDAVAAAAAAGLGPRPASSPAAQQRPQHVQQALSEEVLAQGVAVTCINLLHANPKKASELMLSSHFQDAMRHVRRRLGGDTPIKVVNFDWHGNMGRLTEEKAVEGFWSLMEPFVKQTGFACGWMEAGAAPQQGQPGVTHAGPAAAAAAAATSSPQPSGPASPAAAAAAVSRSGGTAAEPTTAWPPFWRMGWSRQQTGLLRFNCADSLDRTNAATCFAMLPVLQEQLRVLGIGLECAMQPATAALLRSRQRSSAGDIAALERQQQQQGDALDAAASALPEGWEVRQHEGRLLYIDHINKTTQWTPPSPANSALASSAGGGSGKPGSRPGSATPLSARMMQSASDMLARLQQRSAASPGSSGGAAGGGVGAGGATSPAKGTPLQHLERRSSPPRMHAEGGAGGGGGQYWRRDSSSNSLNGAVPHAASAPDVTLGAHHNSAGFEAPASPGAPDRVKDPLRPWAFFEYDINDVRDRLYKEAVSDYVEMFRVHGDIHSFLYTGSPAMHSHVLNLVVQGGKGYGATSGVGKLQNLRVAVQRRWNNTMSDTSRQQAMELFLGLRIHDSPNHKGYFPGLPLAYRDSTQVLLGGMEAFETAPLPPSHSRHASLGSACDPLGAGAPAADAAPWSGAAPPTRLPLLEEEGQEQEGLAGGMPAEGPEAGSPGGRGDAEDHAHAVPGVPAVEHDGVLGVRQDLLDLEPLSSELTALERQQQQQQYAQQQQQYAQQEQQQQQGPADPAHLSAAHTHSSSSVESVPAGSGTPTDGAGLAAFDPLGAVLHPVSAQPGQAGLGAGGEGGAELISFDGAAVPAGTERADSRSALDDLLL